MQNLHRKINGEEGSKVVPKGMQSLCVPVWAYECVMKNESVRGVDLLRTRTFGNKIYVDIEIRVDGKLTLWEAHAIAESVHDLVETEFSKVKHIMVHVNPC